MAIVELIVGVKPHVNVVIRELIFDTELISFFSNIDFYSSYLQRVQILNIGRRLLLHGDCLVQMIPVKQEKEKYFAS